MEETPCEMYGVVEDEEHWLERWEGGGASGICWRRDRRPVRITGVPLAGRMGMGARSGHGGPSGITRRIGDWKSGAHGTRPTL
ncbi:hypothetical protein CesoFtcFv8_001460 [Champsocephalus esox]|uniref:Uncharacterized protein n=1 Tax=Champsocephalus esox TaxID=159716 RepID=A0AAN8D4P9_9TELE|nr:hypothetical protein CesoFtcFv8_001460 [Champsocephalus esox]